MPTPAPSPQRRIHAGWIAAGIVLALIAGAAGAVAWWLPSDDELARRLEAEASALLGQPVTIGALHWTLRPQPTLVLTDVRAAGQGAGRAGNGGEDGEDDGKDEGAGPASTAGTPSPTSPLTAARITARARWAQLLGRREVALTELTVDNANVPQRTLSTFRIQLPQGAAGLPWGLRLAAVPLEHAAWTDLRWIGRRGRALAYAGEADFDTGWRPRHARLERPGAATPTRLVLTRESPEADRWRAEVTAGGRTAPGGRPRWRITGAVDFQGVDVPQLLGAFGRRSLVDGRAAGHTDLDAQGDGPATLARSLHSRTRFHMAPATLRGFDLEQAVKSAGRQRGGSTPLDRLDGTVDTQADRGGTIVRYSGLRATSGVLTATGSAVVQDRRLKGDVAVDLVDGVVGVPLEFGGTVSQPTLSLPPGAIAGAAVGTAIAPGIGTALGARIGETVRRIFGGDDAKPPPPARRQRSAPAGQ
ncbi:hypothetical protein [Xylophilus sp.]|uniref:hypothetical protein n=1 Tax=Xylophilus sp. TaxID=2653893 RepID=UPI0013B5B260|nr:hypothetical protein [Xylophilus sp.]KAF1050249.1 MAG: hypothetical protein GAK38_00275 [Xylophilus sp.]